MKVRKFSIALLLAAFALIGAAAVIRGAGCNGAAIRMAGQVGIVAELLEGTARYMEGGSGKSLDVRGGHKMDFMMNNDCCAAVTSWGLGAGSLHGAVMCPDAAAEFLAANQDFISLGPIMFNSDVFMTGYPAGTVRKAGIAHKRGHQLVMAQAKYREAQFLPMLPAGLPYALEKGEVEAIIVDLGVAASLGGTFTAWDGPALPTQVLVIRRDFAESGTFSEFTRAFGQARQDMLEKYAYSGLAMPELESQD